MVQTLQVVAEKDIMDPAGKKRAERAINDLAEYERAVGFPQVRASQIKCSKEK